MPRTKKEPSDTDVIAKKPSRNSMVCKRNDLIQQARFDLSVTEQRIILYAISKINPEDTYIKEYTFDIKDFYSLCGIDKDSYTVFKKTLKALADKSWWAKIDDKGTESLLRWFSTLRLNSQESTVTVKFHEDMFPYLINLRTQATQGLYYTQYELQNILPMRSKYSIRLYELLKSYKRNNEEWYFDLNNLKKQLLCENYEKFGVFRLKVLDIAVKEINEFSDLNIEYSLAKEGYKYRWITFTMTEKTAGQKIQSLVQQSLLRINN